MFGKKVDLFKKMFALGQYSLEMPELNGAYDAEELNITLEKNEQGEEVFMFYPDWMDGPEAIGILTPDGDDLQPTDQRYKEIRTVLRNTLPLIERFEVRAGIVMRTLVDTASPAVSIKSEA
jgi:hypothetical protein